MRGLGLTACLGVLLLVVAAPAVAQKPERQPPRLTPVADDALASALESGELTEAQYALERARSVFQLARVRTEFGDVERPGPRDATLILRDLSLREAQLSAAERRIAERILARPDDGDVPISGTGWTAPSSHERAACDVHVCVHWVISTVDKPNLTDTPPPDVPDWVGFTLQTLEEVWSAEIVALGYRAPLPDDTSVNDGGSALLDVYIADIGDAHVFGYCASDDPNVGVLYAVSAYCVVDNDYDPDQYGTAHTPEQFLQVTTAHEFHHASQFAYDWEDDGWLLEGTATNMEETVYPEINDNITFLDGYSPLTRPASPLDRWGLGNSEYGSWIFWRFVQEKIGGDPAILREIWDHADAYDPSPLPGDDPPDDYSLQAVRHELTERGLGFTDVFASFATTNRLLDYADAEIAGYPSTPLTKTFTVGKQAPVTPWRSWRISHLAARFFSFRPGQQVPADAKLRVITRLPANGAEATLIVVEDDGSTSTRTLARSGGYARGSARFGHSVVKRVEVVLTNGSTRTKCWRDLSSAPFYSCFGRPLDDRRVFELRGKLLP